MYIAICNYNMLSSPTVCELFIYNLLVNAFVVILIDQVYL